MGVISGNLLPMRLVTALSVALYGMFIAIIVPPARKDKVLAVLVVLSMAFSWIFARMPALSGISSGMRVIILTVALSLAAALLFPIRQEGQDHA